MKDIQDLAPEIRDVYQIAYNNAIARGESPDEADAAGWAAVAMGWELVNGEWVRRM